MPPEKNLLRKVKIFRALSSFKIGMKDQKKLDGEIRFFDTENGRIRVLCYNLEYSNKSPAIINLHGGGFTLGHADMDDPFLLNIAKTVNAKIFNIDYPLSPEAAFPSAINQITSAIRYIKNHAEEFAIDPENIAIGGHSAGGNFTTALCIIDGEKKEFNFKCAILDYPPLDIATDPAKKPKVRGAIPDFLSRMFNSAYCSGDEAKNPLVSPIFASTDQLLNFPPTLIISCGKDSLAQEDELFRDKLKNAGINVAHKRFENSVHGFTHERDSQAKVAWQLMADFYKKHLNS